jgi:hypothetical protein
MDMDDDFVGTLEFDLSAHDAELVNRAISLAAQNPGDGFAQINPLIAIMRWWQTQAHGNAVTPISPEKTLVEACRAFLLAHESGQLSGQ